MPFTLRACSDDRSAGAIGYDQSRSQDDAGDADEAVDHAGCCIGPAELHAEDLGDEVEAGQGD